MNLTLQLVSAQKNANVSELANCYVLARKCYSRWGCALPV